MIFVSGLEDMLMPSLPTATGKFSVKYLLENFYRLLWAKDLGMYYIYYTAFSMLYVVRLFLLTSNLHSFV